MEITEALKTIEALSPSEIDKLIKTLRKKDVAKKRVKKKVVSFNLRVNERLFRQIVNESDVIKHFMEVLIPDIKFMPPYAVKSQIIGMFEMLAEASESMTIKNRWRHKAVEVMLIKSQKHLFSYVATVATGIRI